MFELGNVVFNFEMWSFWAILCYWIFLCNWMPKRGTIGTIIAISIVVSYVIFASPEHKAESFAGENIYVGVILGIACMFTSAMQPSCWIFFWLGRKVA